MERRTHTNEFYNGRVVQNNKSESRYRRYDDIDIVDRVTDQVFLSIRELFRYLLMNETVYDGK